MINGGCFLSNACISSRRRAVYAVLGAILLAAQALATTPVFLTQPLNITYSIGNKAELRCSVGSLGKRTVIWRKLSDPVPISIGSTKFTPLKKYRISHQSDSNEWVLTIKNIDYSDAGEYECRVSGAGDHALILSLIMRGTRHTHMASTPTSIDSKPGQRVELPCKVNNLKKNKVIWLDERGQLLTFRRKVYSGNTRLSVLHRSREEWTLQIKKLNEKDFGRYTCLVNTDPVLTRTLMLKNTEPPRRSPTLIRTKFKNKITAVEGESVTLTCEFTSSPPAKITWHSRVKVGNKRVKTDYKVTGETLQLTALKPENSGDYVCTAKNNVPPAGRGKIRVVVKPNPVTTTPAPKTTPHEPTGLAKPILYTENKRVGKRKGHDAHLVCRAVGKPRPDVYWKRHNIRINNSFKHRVQSSSSGNHRTHSTLRILHVLRDDFGEYECIAHNNQGYTTMSVSLYETFDD